MTLTTTAQAAGDAAANTANKPTGLFGSIWGILLIYALFFGVIYLIVIRPNSKKRKQEEELRKNIEIGDEIITIGGIIGRVVSIKDDSDTITIETGADRNKMKIKRWAVSSNETVRQKVETEMAAARSQKKGFLDKLNEKLESKQNEKNGK